MKKLILILLFLANVNAIESKDKEHIDNMRFSLGGLFITDHNTVLSVDSHNGASFSIDLQKSVDMETDAASLNFDAYYRFTPAHRVEFGHTSIKSEGVTTTSQVLFPGTPVEIPINVGVKSHMDLGVTKLVYAYSFYHNEKIEVALSAGLHITDLSFGITPSVQGNSQVINLDMTPPLPVVGGRLNYNITPEWSVLTSMDVFAISFTVDAQDAPELDGISGYMTSFNISTEYRFFENFSAGVGFNSYVLDFDVNRKQDYDIGYAERIEGVTAFASLHF